MKRKFTWLTATAVAATMILSALPAYAEEALAEDQTYNTFLTADPTTLDISLRADAYSSGIMINTMEGLIRTGEENGEYVVYPGLAESWEPNEDGTVWTFHLRESVWEDGEPVTADQFVYSLQRSAAPETGSPSSFFLEPLANFTAVNTGEMDISELGVEAPDESTLVITLANPTPSFLMMLDATVYYPQRQDKVEEYGDQFGSEAQYYIANGPFRVSEWVHNSKIVLEKNENYWDAENVTLDTVNIAIMPEETTYYNAYQNNEIDYVGVGEQEWLDKFSQDPDSVYVNTEYATMNFIFYNTKDDIFQNANIRKAFTLALDREDINDMCFGGLRVPAEGWVPQGMSSGTTDYRAAAGNLIANMNAELEANGQTPQDLLLAGMEELGLGDDPASLDLTFSLAGTGEWYRTLGEYLQQVYAEALGVDLKLSFSEWGIFYDNILSGNYQMGFMSWGAYYNDPYDMLSLFVSSYDAVSTGWANEEFDALLTAAAKDMDDDARLQEYIDAENILITQDCAICPVAVSQGHSFYKNYVKGYGSLNFNNMGYKTMYIAEH